MSCYCSSCGECGLAPLDAIVTGVVILGMVALILSPIWWGFWRK